LHIGIIGMWLWLQNKNEIDKFKLNTKCKALANYKIKKYLYLISQRINMKGILKNILAVIVGLFIGGAANMGIVMLSGSIIPLPEGIDPTDMESITSNFHLYQPKHFLIPFLAHALGTLIGAFLTAKIAATHQMKFALVIGVFFLIGGIQMASLLPAPIWFDIIDLGFAYIPISFLGYKLAKG